MQRKVKPTILGIFVFGAAIILAGALLFIYARTVLLTSHTYVLNFEDTIQGLRVGSPVSFRGYQLGQVTDIRMYYDRKRRQPRILVYFQFLRGRTTRPDMLPLYKRLVLRGLKARLEITNVFTGQSGIELVMMRDKPVRKYEMIEGHLLIPTVKAAETEVNFQKVMVTAEETLDSIKMLVQSQDVKDVISNANRTLISANTTLVDGGKLFNNLDDNLTPVSKQFYSTMTDLKGAARAHRKLMDYLSRHPDSLIKGKRG